MGQKGGGVVARLSCLLICCLVTGCQAQQREEEVDDELELATGYGWLEQCNNGRRILDELDSLTPDEVENFRLALTATRILRFWEVEGSGSATT